MAVSGGLISALAMHEKTTLIGVEAAKMRQYDKGMKYVHVPRDLVVGEEYRKLDALIRERRGFMSWAEAEAMRLR